MQIINFSRLTKAFVLLQIIMLTTSCTFSNTKTFTVKDFPPYVDLSKVDRVFGQVSIKVDIEHLTIDSQSTIIVKDIRIYGSKISKTIPLAHISKNGLITSNNEDISPNGFKKNSLFNTKYFIGFTDEVCVNPFIIYGIFKNENGKYSETDPLIIWDFDYTNNSIKLYQPNL